MESFISCFLVTLLCLNVMVEGAPTPFHRKRCVNPIAHIFRNDALQKCKYGVTVDECGQKHCMKGPGEFCGGLNDIYGVCSSGLICSDCNRCRGCSLTTLDCFEDECLKILYRYYGKAGRWKVKKNQKMNTWMQLAFQKWCHCLKI